MVKFKAAILRLIQSLGWWKLSLLTIWFCSLVILFYSLNFHYGSQVWTHTDQVMADVRQWILSFGYLAPLIFLFICLGRSFILLPATAINIAAGYLFGAVEGIILIVIGLNLSAWIAYGTSRFFGRSWFASVETGTVEALDDFFSRYGWKAVMFTHWLSMPFDLINYAFGLSRVGFKQFAIGTFLGILPLSLAFVILGEQAITWWILTIISLSVFGGAWLFGHILRKKIGFKLKAD